MSLKHTKIYQSFSSEETKKLGEKFAKKIVARPERSAKKDHGAHALVFALTGELGAGKTTFVQGFFKGLGLKRRAPSPTFIIMRRHPLRRKKFKNIFHADAYRLKKAAHLAALGFKEILTDPKNIILVEWAERVKDIMPKNTTWLTFRHGKKENERRIVVIGKEKGPQ